MAILKVIEVLANSDKSWEDATKNAVKHAGKSVKNIRSVYVNEHRGSWGALGFTSAERRT